MTTTIKYTGTNQFGFINGNTYNAVIFPNGTHCTVTDIVDGEKNAVLFPGEWVRA